MRKRQLVHIGVGNFHRSHQAEYFQELNDLENANEKWSITGLSLMPHDEKFFNLIKAQDYDYHLVTRSHDGSEIIKKIQVINDLIYAYKELDRAIDILSNADIEIISFTITEGAYLFDQKAKTLDWDNADLNYDLENLSKPKTIFGLLYNVLKRRKQTHGSGVTLMTCDNVRHNGLVLKSALCQFIEKVDENLVNWIEQEVCFPCSMVDRITPASSSVDIEYLSEKHGIDDEVPVVSEAFRQWVLEDNFKFGKPNLDAVGVTFTNDVTPYEEQKIKLLNGGHMALAYVASLAGYEFVDKAMANQSIFDYVRSYMRLDGRPSVPTIQGVDTDDYIEILLQRFGNAAISDQVERLCGDGISKMYNFLMSVVKDAVSDKRELDRLAIMYASYYLYLQHAVESNSDESKYGVFEPQADQEQILRMSQDVQLLLDKTGVGESSEFVSLTKKYIDDISNDGVLSVISKEGIIDG